MAVETKEILKVLEAVLSYLNITLPCQSLSPDAEMGREALLDKVQNLADKLNDNTFKPAECPNSDSLEEPEIYDDVVGTGSSANGSSQDAEASRQSCYIDMQQPENDAPDITDGVNPPDQLSEGGDYEVTESSGQSGESFGNQGATLVKDENCEIPDQKSDVVELLEEEEYDDVCNVISSGDTEFELTEDLLLHKLRNLESTGPKSIIIGSHLSGWLQKQKKKNFLSKWHKRYCILKEQFLFYYQSETDTRSLGVIVLPGYIISEEKSTSKDKFTFKLVPPGKGRSTYLFQVTSRFEFDSWLSALKGICCKKLDRLCSDAFNRVAKKMDEDSEEGSGGEPVRQKGPSIAEEQYDDCLEGQANQQQEPIVEELYEELGVTQQPSGIPPRTAQNIAPPPIPSPSLPPRFQRPPAIPDEGLYDDHLDRRDDMVQKSAAVPAEDLYEGIPGEDYEPESSQIPPVQEDLYEDIGPFQQQASSMAPPPPPTSFPPPLNQGPPLSARPPIISDKRPVLPGIENTQQHPAPPPIPDRNEKHMETRTISKEPGNRDNQPPLLPPIRGRNESKVETRTDAMEPDEEIPSEDDFSYDNVYIGTKLHAPKEADELAFNRGDLIYILQKVNANWWVGCLDKKVGLVPSNLLIAGFAH